VPLHSNQLINFLLAERAQCTFCMQEDEQGKSYLRRWAWVEELTVVLVVVLLVVADRRLALPLLYCFLCYFSSPLSLLFFSFFLLLCLFSSLFIGKNGAGAPSITQRLVGQWPVRWSKGVGTRRERRDVFFWKWFLSSVVVQRGKEEDEQCRSKRHRSGLPLFFLYMKRRRFG